MKYKAVVFDMDGTLLDTLKDLANSTNFALKACGFPKRTADEIKSFVGNGVKKLIELSVPEGTSKEEKEKCLIIFEKHYLAHSQVDTKPYDGIIDLLTELKKRGIKTGVVSNKYHEALISVCDRFFGSLIDYAVGEKEGVPKKPAPDAVFECLKQLNSTKQDTIYVGDSDVDIKTAKNAELFFVGVSWGFRDEKFLRDNKADTIINVPTALLSLQII